MSEYGPREFRRLWPEFAEPSWAAWASIEDAIFGIEPADPELVWKLTGRERLPQDQVSEFWAVVGRGGGKSRFCARLAVFFACGREHDRAPGERIFVGIFAPDRKQAGVTFRYVRGLLREAEPLSRLISREMRESIELRNGVTIEVITASKAAPRGRAYALAIVEEAAFLPQDEAAEPDTELMRALRPALARVPRSLLAVVSSPYARRGALWRTWKQHHGNDDSDSTLVVQADTRTLNPAFPQAEVDRAYDEDPVAARAEYGAEFRSDVESFVRQAVIEAATVPGRHELPPASDAHYCGFLDFAGGSGGDSATLAVAHVEHRESAQVVVLDLVREIRPPFSPEAVCREYAKELRRYDITTARADRYAADWPVEQMAKHGVTVLPADKSRSDLYRELLPMLNSGAVELLDVPRLHAQLQALERRTSRGGKDSIDHPPGGHDDLANAAAGALVLAVSGDGDGRPWLLFTEEGDVEAAELAALEAEVEGLRRELEPG